MSEEETRPELSDGWSWEGDHAVCSVGELYVDGGGGEPHLVFSASPCLDTLDSIQDSGSIEVGFSLTTVRAVLKDYDQRCGKLSVKESSSSSISDAVESAMRKHAAVDPEGKTSRVCSLCGCIASPCLIDGEPGGRCAQGHELPWKNLQQSTRLQGETK